MTVHILSKNSTSEITGVREGDSQPNALDIRLNRVWEMSGSFQISDDDKTHRTKKEVEVREDGWFHLSPGTYEVSFENMVKVGGDEAGIVITRSTLNRNGLFLTSGLYDSGYGNDGNGVMAACLHVEGGPAYIKKGTRIGQYVTWKAEALSSYDGDYGKSGGMDKHLNA